MVSDQAHSSNGEINSASITLNSGISGENYSPSLSAASLSLSACDGASSSYPYPPNHPGSSIPDRDAIHGVKSSDHHGSIGENDIVIAYVFFSRSKHYFAYYAFHQGHGTHWVRQEFSESLV